MHTVGRRKGGRTQGVSGSVCQAPRIYDFLSCTSLITLQTSSSILQSNAIIHPVACLDFARVAKLDGSRERVARPSQTSLTGSCVVDKCLTAASLENALSAWQAGSTSVTPMVGAVALPGIQGLKTAIPHSFGPLTSPHRGVSSAFVSRRMLHNHRLLLSSREAAKSTSRPLFRGPWLLRVTHATVADRRSAEHEHPLRCCNHHSSQSFPITKSVTHV